MTVNMNYDRSDDPESALLAIIVRKWEKNTGKCWGRNGEHVTERETEERWEKYIWKMKKIIEYYFANYFATF